jgi:hypothetical protein
LPPEAQTIDAWFIAGIRIDVGAPGLSTDIRAQFGQIPQIRLIVQPVTRNADGTPLVHDIAGHLMFNFTLANVNDPSQPDCLQRPVPDLNAFNAIVADLAAIRTKLSNGQLGAEELPPTRKKSFLCRAQGFGELQARVVTDRCDPRQNRFPVDSMEHSSLGTA